MHQQHGRARQAKRRSRPDNEQPERSIHQSWSTQRKHSLLDRDGGVVQEVCSDGQEQNSDKRKSKGIEPRTWRGYRLRSSSIPDNAEVMLATSGDWKGREINFGRAQTNCSGKQSKPLHHGWCQRLHQASSFRITKTQICSCSCGFKTKPIFRICIRSDHTQPHVMKLKRRF